MTGVRAHKWHSPWAQVVEFVVQGLMGPRNAESVMIVACSWSRVLTWGVQPISHTTRQGISGDGVLVQVVPPAKQAPTSQLNFLPSQLTPEPF